MIGKIISAAKGVFDIEISQNKNSFDITCPVCSNTRKTEHQKIRCLNVNQSLRMAKCNHCGEGFKFVYEHEFKQGSITEHITGSKLFDLTPELEKFCLIKRKISRETLISCEIKAAKRQLKDKESGEYINTLCLAFPYYQAGILKMIKYRDPQKNFSIEKGSKLILYGLDWVKDTKEMVIVEGEFDRLSYFTVGITNVVSVPNGVTMSQEELKYYQETGQINTQSSLNLKYIDDAWPWFENKEKIYIATDADGPGLKLREELIRRIGKDRCAIVDFSKYLTPDENKPCKDANDVLMHLGSEVLRKTIGDAREFEIDDVVTIDDVQEDLMNQYRYGLKKGLSTGYPALDAHFTWRMGHFIIINGFPGMGKTSAVLNLLMLTAILYDWKWGIYSPENYPVSDVYRMLMELIAGKSFDKDVKNRMNLVQYEIAIDFIREHFKVVDKKEDKENPGDSQAYSPKELRLLQIKMIKKYGLHGFFKDPWNALYHTHHGETLDEYLERELSEEQKLSTRYRCLNLVAVHPPTPIRQKETVYRAPTAFEITGGAIWFKKAYEMICINKVQTDDLEDTTSEIHVQKVKSHKLVGVPTSPGQPVRWQYVRNNGRFIQIDGYDPYKILLKNKQEEMAFEEF
jgi:twinkle protein